ncbi:MAG: heme ABC transporter permease [Alphaproteobacteria bacterium]
MQKYANPARFMKLAAAVQPVAGWLALLAFGIAAYLALFVAPADYQQGETVRIMYVHVPAASLSLGVFVAMALSSAVAIVWRHPVADRAAKSLAPVGACFTFLALVTGALWGAPMWGTPWVWDARLTSELVQFFLYLAYMGIWAAYEDEAKAARAARIFALVAVVNVPIVRFSVEWWNTLHQPASLIKSDGPAIHPDLLWPLMAAFAAYSLLALWVMLAGTRTEILRQRVKARQRQQASAK